MRIMMKKKGTGSAPIFGGVERAMLPQPEAPYVNDDWFGKSISFSGDGTFFVVAAQRWNSQRGGVFVYQLVNGVWNHIQTISGGINDYVGYDVTISNDGTTIIAGEHGYDAGASLTGAISIYKWDGNLFAYQSRKTHSTRVTFDYLGSTVAISGDSKVVASGAYGRDNKGTQSGSVFIWEADANGDFLANQIAEVYPADLVSNDAFGEQSISLSQNGDRLLASCSRKGKAYMFERSGNVWNEITTFVSSSSVSDMSLDSSVVIVNNAGNINVYREDVGGGSWSLEQQISSPDPQPLKIFGTGAAISADGTTIVIGAYGVNGSIATDSAYVYQLSNGTWMLSGTLVGSDTELGDRFGNGVAIDTDGNTIGVGATYAYHNGIKTGKAYIFS